MKNKFKFLSNMNMSLEISDRDKRIVPNTRMIQLIIRRYIIQYLLTTAAVLIRMTSLTSLIR